ncbi:conserved hypothetical protein [Histoplasma capsulatum H143]|uniref:Uncharacterized protein n=1 Tax=Ajellomyces capsulatus (strain H143) TaxID=544712 RepID=C6HF89_AJECH|nr:conserved hypothetical protein [Histoplasma capsulatum H143]
MAHCDHISWLELVEGNGGSFVFYGCHSQIFADWDSGHCGILPAFNSLKVCHCKENIPVNWPTTSWQPYDLILAHLAFLFCDVICIFTDDIESSSSLPPHI